MAVPVGSTARGLWASRSSPRCAVRGLWRGASTCCRRPSRSWAWRWCAGCRWWRWPRGSASRCRPWARCRRRCGRTTWCGWDGRRTWPVCTRTPRPGCPTSSRWPSPLCTVPTAGERWCCCGPRATRRPSPAANAGTSCPARGASPGYWTSPPGRGAFPTGRVLPLRWSGPDPAQAGLGRRRPGPAAAPRCPQPRSGRTHHLPQRRRRPPPGPQRRAPPGHPAVAGRALARRPRPRGALPHRGLQP